MAINGDVTGSHAFKYPHGLALDPEGNIRVTASFSNTIKVFTPEWTYVRSYGDFNGPSGSPVLDFWLVFVAASVIRVAHVVSYPDPTLRSCGWITSLPTYA